MILASFGHQWTCLPYPRGKYLLPFVHHTAVLLLLFESAVAAHLAPSAISGGTPLSRTATTFSEPFFLNSILVHQESLLELIYLWIHPGSSTAEAS